MQKDKPEATDNEQQPPIPSTQPADSQDWDDLDEARLKQQIEELRKRDPFIYR
jgi:hypothetical protein